jgi:pimeloyl-ACP methyl ester carboxylesterase
MHKSPDMPAVSVPFGDKKKRPMTAQRGIAPILIWVAVTITGCQAPMPMNPTFSITVSQAKAALREMGKSPKPLTRPVVILAGYLDPGFASGHTAKQLRLATGSDHVISMSFSGYKTFDACRARVIEQVDGAFPSEDPAWTAEVDVVGISMGGLIARYAAMPDDDRPASQRRLRIARLFTISTPHQGANMASLPTWSRRQLDMRKGSAFLGRLADAWADAGYELYPYVRLRDTMVGPVNTAPLGQTPWWVPNRPFELAHMWSFGDPRILADIARRLRDEQPFAAHRPAPLPGTVDRQP